ncbi:MAG: hypothetical protein LLG05_14120 [Porphyromonadaceae bacterium]|nr:hypothetical protein [Porphyromonadaceae bacterium]
MTKRKSLYSVRQAVEMAFFSLDRKFHSIRLCQAVRELTGRAFLMDGSILRRLREARAEHPELFGYVVIDNEAGLYEKKALMPAEVEPELQTV